MRHSVWILCLSLAACGQTGLFSADRGAGPDASPQSSAGEATGANPEGGGNDSESRPPKRPDRLADAPKPPANARTAEQFDTTTKAERVAAKAAPEPAGERALGGSVATLGDPAKPGFWLETPLVDAETPGRVSYGGQSANVTLIPIDGPKTAGSRMSLPAMRVLNAPLAGLVEIEVFAL